MEKIQDREWVILECQNRIPEDLDTTKELLEYGLKQTDILPPNSSHLSDEDIDTCFHRIIFLTTLDLLQTYRIIFPGKITVFL